MVTFISIILSSFIVLSAIAAVWNARNDIFIDEMEEDDDPVTEETWPIVAAYYFGYMALRPWTLPGLMWTAFDDWRSKRSVENFDHNDPKAVEELLQRANELLKD